MATLRVADVVNAAVDALKADSALTTLLGGTAKVYNHVPDDTVPPYVLVMGGREAEALRSFRDETGREVDILTEAVSSYRGSLQVDQITARIVTVLTTDGTYSSVTGYLASEFVESPEPESSLVDGRPYYIRSATCRVLLD